MTTLAALTNHQIRLAARPNGLPTREGWDFTTEPVAEPVEGGVLVKTLAISLDPAMRGWMNEGKSYIPPVGIGEVMRAGGIGEVIASKNPAFAVGDLVSCTPGVQLTTSPTLNPSFLDAITSPMPPARITSPIATGGM